MELRLRQPDLEIEEEIVEDNAIRPVIKYPGGKSGIAEILCELAPREFGVYFEIFGGGLGFGLRLLQKNRVEEVVVSDVNIQLITLYWALVEDPRRIRDLLASPKFENTEENFYAIRKMDRNKDWHSYMCAPENRFYIAARVIFLSKLSFNGLWRENQRGEHNGPYCKDPSKTTFQEDNLNAVAEALKSAHIVSSDFMSLFYEAVNYSITGNHELMICPQDFIFMDPPYVESWNSYTGKKWDYVDLEVILRQMKVYSCMGAFVMVTMKDTEKVREMFTDYRIVELTSSCRINSKGSERKDGLQELVIMNYLEDQTVIGEGLCVSCKTELPLIDPNDDSDYFTPFCPNCQKELDEASEQTFQSVQSTLESFF